MTIRTCLPGMGALWVSALLVACGGGGGSGSGSGSTSAPAAAPPYTLTPSTAQASFVAGWPTTIAMSAKQTVAFTGLVYVQVSADAAVVESPIAVSTNGDGTFAIAAGSQDSTYLFAFEAASGTQDFAAQMASQWEHYLAPTILGGLVYSDGGTYGGLYAFDTTTGANQFFAHAGQYDGWTPAVDADHAYAYIGGALCIFDNQTGALVGSIAEPTYSWNGYTTAGAPALGGANTVYAGNLHDKSANSLVAFDTSSYTVRWSIHGAYSGNPAYADGVLFAADSSPFALEAYNETDGAKLWTWTPPSGNSSFVSDVLVTNNLVFVSTDANTFAIDRGTHLPVWSHAAAGSLALSANGILYIKGSYGIVAINLR